MSPAESQDDLRGPCMLVLREQAADHVETPSSGPRPSLVIALHERGGDGAGALATARTLFPCSPIVAPQAARPCNPLQSNGDGAQSYAGYSWYLGTETDRPEGASFGDSLAQLEALIDERTRRGPHSGETGRPRLMLYGRGQGAALALTLALYLPDRIAAVIAENGTLPLFDGWAPPPRSLARCEVWLCGTASDAQQPAAALLTARGGRVYTGQTAGEACAAARLHCDSEARRKGDHGA